MVRQFYDRLLPKRPEPEPLTLEEQRNLAAVALRLVDAVGVYLYTHGSYGTIGEPPLHKRTHNEKTCPACVELREAMEDA